MRTVEGAHQAHERILQYTVDGSCGKGEAPMDPAKRRLLDSHAGWVIARAESSGRESSWNRPMATRREGHYFPRWLNHPWLLSGVIQSNSLAGWGRRQRREETTTRRNRLFHVVSLSLRRSFPLFRRFVCCAAATEEANKQQREKGNLPWMRYEAVAVLLDLCQRLRLLLSHFSAFSFGLPLCFLSCFLLFLVEVIWIAAATDFILDL